MCLYTNKHTHTQDGGIPISNQCHPVKQTQQTCECRNGQGVVCLYGTDIESGRQVIKHTQKESSVHLGWRIKLYHIPPCKSFTLSFCDHRILQNMFNKTILSCVLTSIVNTSICLFFQTVSATATPTAAATSTTWTSSRASAASTTPGARTASTAGWDTSATLPPNWTMRASASVSWQGGQRVHGRGQCVWLLISLKESNSEILKVYTISKGVHTIHPPPTWYYPYKRKKFQKFSLG